MVARKARAKRGRPAVVKKGHRGVYFNKDEQGGKANSLALAVISGTRVILARTQFRHPTAQDCVDFFFGDNENVYQEMTKLFMLPKNRHHTLIPNPHYSPFLNAIEYLMKALQQEEIHPWRLKLNEEKAKIPTSEPLPKQKWDIKHRPIFSTERALLLSHSPRIRRQIPARRATR